MSRHVTTMTIHDVDHYTDAERAQIIASYPAHEREARAMGIPTLGSGRIYPVPEELIKVAAFPIPKHWPRIAGLDFGWTHPTAAAWLAWDRDTDTVYLYDAYRAAQQTPEAHSITLRSKGAWIPVAWPHDGENATSAGAGQPLAHQYRGAGVNMLENRATHPPDDGQEEGGGGNSVEAGVMRILDRMQSGRFKVFEHLNDFFEEYRLYHRKDGRIVKEDDDLLDAVRTAEMMLRFAITEPKRSTLGAGPNYSGRRAGY